MSITISNVSNNETFAALVQKVNQLSDIVTSNVVTADTTTAGSSTVGNVNLNGKLAANVLATKMLQGGDLLNSANLVIVSNTAITMNNIDVMRVSYDTAAANIQYAIVANNMTLNSDKLQFAVANMMFDGANVHINSYLYVDNDMYANGTMFIKNMMTANGGATVQANLTVSGNTSITGKLAVTGNTNLTGSLTVSGNAAITGNLTANWAGLTTANVTTLGANTLTVRLDASVGNNFVVGGNLTVSNGFSYISVGNSTVNTAITTSTVFATTIVARNNLYVGNSTVNTAITSTVINAANVVVANTLTVGENVVVTLNMQANSANAVVMTANTLSIANNSSFGGNILVTGNVSGGNVASFKTMAANALTANVFTVNTSVTVGNSTVNTAITTTQITVSNLVANNITVNNLSVPLAINTINDVNANNVIAVNSVTGNNLSATVNVSTAGITVTANAVIANAYITNANTRTSWTNTAVANAMSAATGNVVTLWANNFTAANTIGARTVTANNITVVDTLTSNTVSAFYIRGRLIDDYASPVKNLLDNGEFNIRNRQQTYYTGYPVDRWKLSSFGADMTGVTWGAGLGTNDTTDPLYNQAGVIRSGSNDIPSFITIGWQKTAGAFTGVVNLDQIVDPGKVTSVKGKNVFLSMRLKKGSSYVAGVTRVQVFTGTGSITNGDAVDWTTSFESGGIYFTGGTRVLNVDVSGAISTSWNATILPIGGFEVDSTVTQIVVRIISDYGGNATAQTSWNTNNHLWISQPQLEVVAPGTPLFGGGFQYSMSPYQRKSYIEELMQAKRFYQTSWPGWNRVGVNYSGAARARLVAPNTVADFGINLDVPMITTPAVRMYSPYSGNGNILASGQAKIYNASTNTDITVTGVSAYAPTSTTSIGSPTFSSTGSANHLLLGHWEAHAEGSGASSSWVW
jgi:hypothetical protein